MVQRNKLPNGNISFTNVSLKYPESQDKATRVLQLLSVNTAIKSFLDGRTCRITLEKRDVTGPGGRRRQGGRRRLRDDGGLLPGELRHRLHRGHALPRVRHPSDGGRLPNMRDEEDAFRSVPLPGAGP
ncbi:hypothetical protein ACRAWF_13570 [Streptomyces sp. L7]